MELKISDDLQKTMQDALNKSSKLLNASFKPFIEQQKELNKQISKIMKGTVFIQNQKIKNTMKEIHEMYKNSELKNIEILGNLGWAMYDYGLKIFEESDPIMKTNFTFPQEVFKMLENNECTKDDIDYFLSKNFTLKKIEFLIQKIINNSDEVEKEKIEQAFRDYKGKKYYECALILFGILDSIFIKQNKKDADNGLYNIGFGSKKVKDCKGNDKIEFFNDANTVNANDGTPKIKQGWDAFTVFARNNLMPYLNNKKLKYEGKNKIGTIKNLLAEIKENIDMNSGLRFFSIAFTLASFYNDIDWEEYPKDDLQLNRNWLMHGMIPYENVKKEDCIKLFLVLYQITSYLYDLYNNEFNNEVKVK